MDFEKLGRTIFEAITGKKEESQVDSTSTEVESSPVVESTPKEVTPEVDPRDIRIKELEELLAQKNSVLTEKDNQINALKELTSVDNPTNEQFSLQELIEKGEF